MKFVVLQLEANSLSVSHIAKVFELAFIKNPRDSDVDFKECNGRIQIPRLVPDHALSRNFDRVSGCSASSIERCRLDDTIPNTTTLRADGQYIVVGGLGGLGRSIARSLVEKGAKSIILVSRSGEINDKMVDVLKAASAADVKIQVVTCDVGSLEDVQRMISAG